MASTSNFYHKSLTKKENTQFSDAQLGGLGGVCSTNSAFAKIDQVFDIASIASPTLKRSQQLRISSQQ